MAFNTLRQRQNCHHFTVDIFKCIFLNENVWISQKIWVKFVTKVQIKNIPALVQIMAWHRQGDKPLSEPMMVSLLMYICVTRLQWVKLNHHGSLCTDGLLYIIIYVDVITSQCPKLNVDSAYLLVKEATEEKLSSVFATNFFWLDWTAHDILGHWILLLDPKLDLHFGRLTHIAGKYLLLLILCGKPAAGQTVVK